MEKYFKLLAAALLVLGASSCSNDVKRSLGIGHTSPDEYSILKNPPLSVPPTFELVPPSDETLDIASDSAIELKQDAQLKVATPKDKTSGGLSAADKRFMEKSNAHQKQEDIRELMVEENEVSTIQPEEEKKQGETKKEGGFLSKIKSWF